MFGDDGGFLSDSNAVLFNPKDENNKIENGHDLAVSHPNYR